MIAFRLTPTGMGKRLFVGATVALSAWILTVRTVEAQAMFREGASAWSSLLPAASRTLQEPYRSWEKLRLIEAALFFQHEADGGGDGGSGGGDGGGDGGSGTG